jgi:hypothetical protein
MHERIKELISEATIKGEEYLPGNDGHPTPTVYFDKEKFAELIVQEFSKQVQIEGRFGLEREQTLIRLCCENAKKHFGVKE